MKLRKWVKVLLVVVIILGILAYIKDFNKDYENCMKYNNNNKNICDTLKN